MELSWYGATSVRLWYASCSYLKMCYVVLTVFLFQEWYVFLLHCVFLLFYWLWDIEVAASCLAVTLICWRNQETELWWSKTLLTLFSWLSGLWWGLSVCVHFLLFVIVLLINFYHYLFWKLAVESQIQRNELAAVLHLQNFVLLRFWLSGRRTGGWEGHQDGQSICKFCASFAWNTATRWFHIPVWWMMTGCGEIQDLWNCVPNRIAIDSWKQKHCLMAL
jgi:hypothetical protein